MPHLSKRKFAPIALAIAATPLLAPAGANAALAGALTLNSTVTPDLISATVTNVNASSTTVNYCFNKTLGSAPVAANFVVRSYRNSVLVPATSASATGQCAAVVFNGITDPSAFTTATAAAGAVVNAASGAPTGNNNADSTALILPVGTTGTNNGTRGRSTAPDLVGASTSGTTATFTFDEALTQTPTVNKFSLLDNTGTTVATGQNGPGTLSADRKSYTVNTSGTIAQVATAVRAVYNGTTNANPAASLASNDNTPYSAVGVNQTNGATTQSDPIQAILTDNGNSATVDLVFDQPTLAANVPAANVNLLLSDGTQLATAQAGTPQTNQNTIRYVSAAGTQQGEYIVGVVVTPVAGVTGATVPAGGNAGAFASGFTTAPDARGVQFDTTTGSATVTLDQRYASAVAAGFRRVDSTGTVNTQAPTSISFGNTAAPGQTTIVANYGTNGLSGSRGLQLLAGAVTTSLANAPGNTNIDQIVAPSASNAG